jgi:ABC-type branched-subunit amino acid transport system ATPase component
MSADAPGVGADTPSIRVAGVTKRFGGVTALKDVDADWTGPGIVGLIGPNGSGKSTLMGILSGVIRPTSGSLVVDGETITRPTPRKLAKLGVGRTFQIARIADNLRVWENLLIGGDAGLGGKARREFREFRQSAVMDLAVEAGIAPILDKWPKDITLADKKRIELVRAVALRPRVLLLDEPTAGLSGHDAAEFLPLIHRAAQTALVVIVEHNMQMIGEIAPTCLALIDGEVVASGTPADVLASETVRRAYIGIPASAAARSTSPSDTINPSDTADQEAAR